MPNSAPETVQAGYETRDVHVRGVWLTALGIVVCCVVIFLVVMLMFHLLQRGHEEAGQAAAGRGVTASVSASVETFPGPRLQVAPETDLAAFRAREDAELEHYGWIDRKAGVVRLPIERAMDLIAQRGLPVEGQPGAPAATRTVVEMQQARPSDWTQQQQPQQAQKPQQAQESQQQRRQEHELQQELQQQQEQQPQQTK